MKTQLLLVILGVCLLLPSFAAADDSGLDAAKKKFSGVYVSKRGVKKERKAINKTIETLVDKMSFYKRPFARSALKDSTKPCPKLQVVFSGDKMAINCLKRVKAKSPADGTAVRWTDDEGDKFRLSQKLEKNRMVQVFRGGKGARKNVYRLKDGGKTLVVKVKITSDELPRALEYTLELRRK